MSLRLLKHNGAIVPVTPELMFRKEAAEYLGYSPHTLAKLKATQQNLIPFIKLKGRAIYRREDLDEYIIDHMDLVNKFVFRGKRQ